jgi:8-oxo-dGTP pyrophosphatase MutT (NUDIX family)
MPTGATVVVYRRSERGVEFLLLHRAHEGPDYAGDWAWTPPAGARRPGEAVDACARRELFEEAGLVADLQLTEFGSEGWFVYMAEVGADANVVLYDSEHDTFEWMLCPEAAERCLPDLVGTTVQRVAAQVTA